MKALPYITYISLSILIFTACTKDPKPDIDVIPETCVGSEVITDTTTGFFIFEKGKQEFGYAKGIKINQPFEASVILIDRYFKDSLFGFFIQGFWPESNGYFTVGEILRFGYIPFGNFPECFALTNRSSTIDSISTYYSIVDDDVGILNYKLDNTADNVLEILAFDAEKKQFKAKFKATYVADKEYLPDLPKKVRFSDVYVEYGY